nr:MAG TPA: replication protein O [Bacteriophage sp.]
MSNESKFIPNFLQVPNAVIDELLPDLTGAELKCYLVVIRKTKGWNKESDNISISQFMKATGLSNSAVIKACESLIKYGLLVKENGARNTGVYAVNSYSKITHEESSQVTCEESSPVKKVHSTCEESSQVTCEESSHTINNIKNTIQNTNKKNIQKKPAILGLESHFEKFWSAGMRKVGKPQALKSFKSSYESYNAKYPLSLDDFTQMLVDDVVKRNQLCQFGFDKLHPVTYLNNWRWLDEYPQSNNKTTEKPSAHNNFSERDYGKQEIPTWAMDGAA